MYSKSYPSFKDSKGLYYLINPKSIKCRHNIINHWNNTIASTALEYIGPTLVPTTVLEYSGHMKEFNEQIFSIENKSLCLRPETAQSLFANLKAIRRQIKGNTIKIHQIGRAYRNEKSTRDGSIRKCEFEQLELHVITRGQIDFIKEYTPCIHQFFTNLGIDPKWVQVIDKPHYSKKTIDLYIGNLEIGCINYRGQHDLWALSEKERSNLYVYEISLGLDRLIECIQ